MQRGMFAALLLAGWLGVGSSFASAQFGSLGQPPFRPHAGLGSGNLSAFNYYNQIQSQLNPDGSLRSPLLGAQQQQTQLQQQQQQDQQNNRGIQTGHAATYFNYSHYYPLTPPMGNAGTSMGTGFGNAFLGGNQFGLGNIGFGGLGTGGFGTGRFGLNNRTIFGTNLNGGGFSIR